MQSELRQMGSDARQRRYRIYVIDPRQIIDLLGNWWHKDRIHLGKIEELPDGYEIMGVVAGGWESINPSDGILVKVYHPSFDPVPQNSPYPRINVGTVQTIEMNQLEPVQAAE